MLRDFQDTLKAGIYGAWQEPNIFNVMPVAPTGAGKTVIVSSIVSDFATQGTAVCAIAHRQELVAQLSLALNRDRVPHGIIAPKSVQSQIVALHHETHGYSLYNYRSGVRVAGVDTLLNHDKNDRWLASVGLVVQDEGHHVLRENKWGRAMGLFPNARGLFPTAHAIRADGCGLGRGADGLVDRLIVGPNCRELINRGFLTDYRLLCPSSDIDFSTVKVTSTGDYSAPQLRAVTHQSSHIVGDVVREYLRHAAGKLGVTFAVDIEAAEEIARAYNAAGVPAAIITGKTPIGIRGRLMAQFRNRVLLQLVSVDCLGEGVDVPAIEVVSMVRKTASFQLYAQQFGRSLRPMVDELHAPHWHTYSDEQRRAAIAASTKTKALVIDHVGNCIFHGLPDMPQAYDLAGAVKRERNSDAIPLRVCTDCMQPYERVFFACPYCGSEPEYPGRTSPEMVDGDLIEINAEVLAAMRKDVARVDGPCHFPATAEGPVRGAIMRNHLNRQRGQATLRHAMQVWGGWRAHLGEDTRGAQRRFFLTFGVDVMSAQALNAEDAMALEQRITAQLIQHNIVEAENAEPDRMGAPLEDTPGRLEGSLRLIPAPGAVGA